MAISSRIARIGLAGVLNTKGFDERVIPTGKGCLLFAGDRRLSEQVRQVVLVEFHQAR